MESQHAHAGWTGRCISGFFVVLCRRLCAWLGDSLELTLVATTLLRKPAVALVVRFAAAALSFFLGLVTARLLGKETFGAINVLLAFVNIGVVFALLGHENLATRTVARGLEQQDFQVVANYRHSASRQVWIAGLLVALVFAGFQVIESKNSFVGTTIFAMLIPLIARVRLGQAMVRGLHHPALALVPDGILRPLLMIAGVILITVVNHMNIGWVGFAFVVAACSAVMLVYRFERGLKIQSSERRNTVPDKTRLISLNLYASSILSVVTTQLAVIVVGFVAGSAEAGLYSAAEKIALAASLISQSIYLAIASRLAAMHAAGDLEGLRRTVRSYTRNVGASSLVLCLILMWFSPELLAFYGDTFSAGTDVLRILLGGILLSGLVGPIGHLLMMTHHEADHAWSMVVSLAVQVALYMVLAPAYGAIGIAVATFLATLVWNGLMMIAVRRRLALHCFLAWA